ncbi:hypothetical protein DU976_05105 [Vibrio navarrensis]|nr:hypothetical protein [Vibrio navarrensis]MBE4580991.1 hypothetical protein [Vibrio navarrensis]
MKSLWLMVVVTVLILEVTILEGILLMVDREMAFKLLVSMVEAFQAKMSLVQHLVPLLVLAQVVGAP